MRNSYTYNDFTYQKIDNGLNDGVQIIHNKKYPNKIHKFYPINNYNVDALLNGYLYASHTFELNDYLDSSPFLWFTSKPLEFYYYKKILDIDIPQDELIKFYEADITRESLCKGYISKFWEVISNLLGVISLTANENSLLMWPHYTQEKGFQLTFNAASLEASIKDKIGEGESFGIFPINYSDNLNPIDISEFDSMHIPFFYATNIKSKKWEYEEEWRFLIGKPMMGVPYSKIGLNTEKDFITSPKNRYTFYDKKLVEQITLGMNFFTVQDFNLEWVNERQFKVSPKKLKNNLNNESHKKLLTYIHNNLKDKIYHSGIKYELDDNGIHYLIRTKERLDIEKVGWDTYVFSRTDDIIKIF